MRVVQFAAPLQGPLSYSCKSPLQALFRNPPGTPLGTVQARPLLPRILQGWALTSPDPSGSFFLVAQQGCLPCSLWVSSYVSPPPGRPLRLP